MLIAPKPTKINLLNRLKTSIPITSIVDVGVREKTGQLIEVFPYIKHYLFEPASEFFGQIKNNYKDIDYELFEFALSDVNSQIFLILSSLEKNGVATHSQISEDSTVPDGLFILDCQPIKVSRFDDLLISKTIEKNFLLKVDVDGKDLCVLKGLGEAISLCSSIIVECTVGNLLERISYLSSRGFVVIDIIDLVYYGNSLYQFDAVMIRKDLLSEKVKPALYPFQNDLWQPLSI